MNSFVEATSSDFPEGLKQLKLFKNLQITHGFYTRQKPSKVYENVSLVTLYYSDDMPVVKLPLHTDYEIAKCGQLRRENF